MFISSISIKNYRVFQNELFEIKDFNVPDGSNEGSGVTVFVGENGSGKTSLLEGIALPLLSFKAEGFGVGDLNNLDAKTRIEIVADREFNVDKVVRGTFKAKGFLFEGGVRSRGNASYLVSTTVSVQKFVATDSESIKEDEADLRVVVSNPWKGPRFDENDIIFLDKNRTYQVRSGTYNKTRFDRLMEDFDFQYLSKKDRKPKNISSILTKDIMEDVENGFFRKAIEKFKEITGILIDLEIIKNYQPFNNAFLAQRGENNAQIEIEKLGAGYEMVFALLSSFYLSKQSGKQLIVLIDEPELHLHPKLQEGLVTILLDLSRTAQIILTSQSPLLIKHLSESKFVKFKIISKEGNEPKLSKPEQIVLPYPSANEVNFVAFNLPSPEYYNEIYGYLHELFIDSGDEENRANRSSVEAFDKFLAENGSRDTIKWKRRDRNGNIVEELRTTHTCIRNKIHHPENRLNDEQFSLEKELKNSTEFLRERIAEFNSERLHIE